MRLRSLISIVSILLMLAVFPVSGYAEILRTINYQGYIADSEGKPVDGTVMMTFSIYDVATGGKALWEETQDVTVNYGVYSVVLGIEDPANNPLDLTFHMQYFLGIAVGTDDEMTPRQPLTSVPYALGADLAYVAGYAYDVADGAVTDAKIKGPISTSKIDLKVFDAEVSAQVNTHANRTDNPHSVTASQVGAATSSHKHDDRYYTEGEVDSLVSNLQSQIAALQGLLQHFTRNGNDIIITGANLHVRNGTGSTYGTVNGSGNIIIGYNEPRESGDDKTGSHNLVVGDLNNYSSFGGIVVGLENAILSPYASVSGGNSNTASGKYSSVSGGFKNTASNGHASIGGGYGNTASGTKSSVSGGVGNTASGNVSSISGGSYNLASANAASVSGGDGNIVEGNSASVSGGNQNKASGTYSSVSGGTGNIASGKNSSVSGGVRNTASANVSSVSGGSYNLAGANAASVSGGDGNQANGNSSSISGGQKNLTDGGHYSSISGGYQRTVSGGHDWSAGSLFETK